MSNKSVIKRNFSKNACYYDRHSGIQVECARRLIDSIKGEIFYNILEIGCGTGVYTRLLYEEYENARITAVDISGAMVEEARKRIRHNTPCFAVADVEHMELEQKFDLITSNACLQWLEHPERTFSRLAQALSDSGVMCFSSYGPETFVEFEMVLREMFGQNQWLSSRSFLSKEILTDMVGRHFDSFDIHEEYFKVDFTSLYEFLQDIKRSGARGYGLAGNVYLGRGLIKRLEKLYIERFGGIVATHHVYFCKAAKSKGLYE